MRRLMFFGLGHLSNGDVSIAADFARQLPARDFAVLFVTTAPVAPHVQAMGLAARALDGATPEENLAIADALVADFRPDVLVAADAFTLNYSTAWSGLSIRCLRERYGGPVASFDQYDYPAADYVVDFYGSHRTQFPRLLDECDFVIRNSPLNRPAPNRPGVVVSRMRCETPGRWRGPSRDRVPTVFLVNSKWEYVNVVRSKSMDQLMAAMPGLLHSHLAALGRPVRVVHVGPVPWHFPVAGTVDYRYTNRLSPTDFASRLIEADLFLTTNAVSVTLTQAVLAGVPSLLLQNHKVLDLGRSGARPAWLAEAAPNLRTAYPFRVFPWGWHEFLTPVLADNPYTDCFLSAGVFERRSVLSAMTALLDDPATRDTLAGNQHALYTALDALPPAGEAFPSAASAYHRMRATVAASASGSSTVDNRLLT